MSDEYDIFISYGHLDDEDPDDVRGWVDLLVERLPGQVAGHLGFKPKVWRDEQSLHGNDVLEGAIGSGVTRSLLIIPVVSPRYVLSDWCRRELESFCAAAPAAGAGDFRSRIFKVIKSPLLLPHLADKEPAPLRSLIGYPFYKIKGDMPHLFNADVSNGRDQDYWDQLRRLAWDIANMLVRLKYAPTTQTQTQPQTQTPTTTETKPGVAASVASSPAPPADDAATASPSSSAAAPSAGSLGGAAPTKFVYLAETATDLAAERERVRDELRQRGYGVLPEQKLPREEVAQTEEAVRRDLARCALAVHLVGAKYGETPEDDGRSVVQIQDELAAEREQAEASFLRLLWTPAGLMTPGGVEVKDKRQREFVAGLQQRVTARAELLQASVEELKTRVVEKLSPPAAASTVAASRDAQPSLKYVYLIYEPRDRPLVRPIREYLFNEHQFEVVNLKADAEGGNLAEYHRKNLTECDAALVYFGNADEPWVRKNLDDLKKAYGYGREADWAARAVYVGAPPSDEKEDYLTREATVIRNVKEFNPEDLREFVSAVKKAGGGGTAA